MMLISYEVWYARRVRLQVTRGHTNTSCTARVDTWTGGRSEEASLLRIDMRVDMCTDMCTDMCIDMCTDVCTDMCVDM